LPNLTSTAKVWVKSSLDAEVLYEQDFTPIPGGYNDILLTTIQTIPSYSSYVIGFTLVLENLNEQLVKPFWTSSTQDDVCRPGGFNCLISTDPNSYGQGANWGQCDPIGNLGIIGYLSCLCLPNLNALSIADPNSEELKLINQEYIYSVTVKNVGSDTQNNYVVQLIDDYNKVLVSKTVTEEIAPQTTASIDLAYACPTAGILTLRGKVILENGALFEYDISESINVMIYSQSDGIKETIETDFTIVPNPVIDNIAISAVNNFHRIEIINHSGQTVVSQPNVGNTASLNISNLTYGVYFVKITTEKGIVMKKVIKN
jgi:hypothetical protein